MAMQAHAAVPYPPIDGEEAPANDVQCPANYEKAPDEAVKQSKAREDAVNQSLTSIGADQTNLVAEDAGELLMQPALKRLRCRVLQIKPPLAPFDAQKSDDDDEPLRADKTCAERCSLSARAMNDRSEIDIYCSKVEEQGSPTLCKAESEASEEEEVECVTPTAREQCIPGSKDLVCPPPPMKKKATAFKRTSRPYENRHRRAANLLVNPPDLHTFPECIRALFDK